MTDIVDLFPKEGWHLERKLFEDDVVNRVQDFLVGKQAEVQERFETWAKNQGISDAKITDGESYRRHQKRLEEYQEKNLPKDFHHYLRGEYDLDTRLNTLPLELFTTKRCQAFLTSFLDAEKYFVHYPPMIRFKVGGAESSIVPVHQDAFYNQHLSQFITVWVPLVDIDSELSLSWEM